MLQTVTYHISIKKTDVFLYVRVEGEANFNNIFGVWKDIAEACKKFKCSRVLRDGILSGQASMLEIFHIGERAHEIELPAKFKMALVCKEKDLERLDFHETVIANRVIGVTTRNFLNRREAELWLSEDQAT